MELDLRGKNIDLEGVREVLAEKRLTGQTPLVTLISSEQEKRFIDEIKGYGGTPQKLDGGTLWGVPVEVVDKGTKLAEGQMSDEHYYILRVSTMIVDGCLDWSKQPVQFKFVKEDENTVIMWMRNVV